MRNRLPKKLPISIRSVLFVKEMKNVCILRD